MFNQYLEGWRSKLRFEWKRQTFDALALACDKLHLSEADAKIFSRRVFSLCSRINWETYDSTRQSFFDLADRLLKPYASRFTAEQLTDMKRRMYTRFMEGRIAEFQHLEKEENCPVAAIRVGEEDFHNTELAMVFAHLPEQPEVKAYLKELDVSWDYDRLHMVSWFSGQLSLGSGKYSRSRPNHSAKTTYQRLVNPYSLLWIAAALGEKPEIVRKAAAEMAPKKTFREKCIAVRSVIPFSRIYELALPLIEQERNQQTVSQNNRQMKPADRPEKEEVVFRYKLQDAWFALLNTVTVLNGPEGLMVRYFVGDGDRWYFSDDPISKEVKINLEDLRKIRRLLNDERLYQTEELEEPRDAFILDGYVQIFELSDGIQHVKAIGRNIQYCGHDTVHCPHSVLMIDALEKIMEILVPLGVPKECFRLALEKNNEDDNDGSGGEN